MKEGEYLELVNDLKAQYDAMQQRLQKRIAFLEQNNKDMKVMLGKLHPLRFSTNQFCNFIYRYFFAPGNIVNFSSFVFVGRKLIDDGKVDRVN